MGATTLPKTGLVKNAVGDTTWATDQPVGFQAIEDRIGLVHAGAPGGAVAGSWFGQTCWDSTNGILYACVGIGDAGAAQWAPFDPTPIGTFAMFIRAGLPAGWLACDGATLRQIDYPDLAAVLPAGLKSGLNFSLPNINEALAPILGGAGAVGALVGSLNSGDGGAFDTGSFDTGVKTTTDPTFGIEAGYTAAGQYVDVQKFVGGAKTNVMQYIDHIYPQTARVQATAHQHAIVTRGVRLLAGVKY